MEVIGHTLAALLSLMQLSGLGSFLEAGGNVLLLIMLATFAMWALIIERYWYFSFNHGPRTERTLAQWRQRPDHTSWAAHRIREKLVSEIRLETERSLGLIKTLIAIAPLLGLLGTVTGMIEVFDVMAITGSSNARAMAGGVSRATIPTMAGMVAALSGVYFSAQLEKRARQEVQKVADKLELA